MGTVLRETSGHGTELQVVAGTEDSNMTKHCTPAAGESTVAEIGDNIDNLNTVLAGDMDIS